MILWKGHCSVHGRFSADVVDELRATHPGINILVHPECRHEVVLKADLVGSTEFIIKTIEAAARRLHLGHRHRAQPGQAARRRAPGQDDRLPRPQRLLLLDDEPHRPPAPGVGDGVAGRRAGRQPDQRRPRHRARTPRSRCSGCSTCRASRTATERPARPGRRTRPSGWLRRPPRRSATCGTWYRRSERVLQRRSMQCELRYLVPQVRARRGRHPAKLAAYDDLSVATDVRLRQLVRGLARVAADRGSAPTAMCRQPRGARCAATLRAARTSRPGALRQRTLERPVRAARSAQRVEGLAEPLGAPQRATDQVLDVVPAAGHLVLGQLEGQGDGRHRVLEVVAGLPGEGDQLVAEVTGREHPTARASAACRAPWGARRPAGRVRRSR